MAQLLVLLLAVSFRGCKKVHWFQKSRQNLSGFFYGYYNRSKKIQPTKKTVLKRAVFFVYLLIKISEILHLSLSKP